MHMETHGAGDRRCIAFHGWGGDHREFAAVAAHRPPGVRIDSVDLPGCGASPAPPAWSLDGIIHSLAEALGPFHGVTLAGYCSGAVFAMRLAHQRPAEVRRLVLIDPFAYVPWYFRIFLAGTPGRRAYGAAFARPEGRRIINRVLRARHSPEDDFTGAFARVHHETALNYLRLFAQVKVREMSGLTLPIDLIHGERTFAAVRDSVRRYRRLWPHARVTELRGLGHLPMVRGAGEIARVLFAD